MDTDQILVSRSAWIGNFSLTLNRSYMINGLYQSLMVFYMVYMIFFMVHMIGVKEVAG